MFWAEIWKGISEFLSEKFHFVVVKFSVYLNRLVFVMMTWETNSLSLSVKMDERSLSAWGNVVDSKMRHSVRKRTFYHVRPTKTQTNLRIGAVRLQSSLSAWRNFSSLIIQNAPREDSDQHSRRLIWMFAWRMRPNVRYIFWRYGSNDRQRELVRTRPSYLQPTIRNLSS